MRFLPRSLAGQLLGLLLVALVAAVAASLLLFVDDRHAAIREADRTGLLERIASIQRVLEKVPPAERPRLAEAAGSPRIRFWTSAESALPAPSADSGDVFLVRQFDRMLDHPLREPARLSHVPLDSPPRPEHRPHGGGSGGPHAMDHSDVVVSLAFSDGAGWLNAQTAIRAQPIPLPWPAVISAVTMAIAIFAVVGFVAGRVTRPLKALAASADAFGRGTVAPPLPEAGPDEARRLIAAFNRMQDRLARFVADRTRMLAAIGHDLRTPITSLKLRAELLDDEETRTRMLATLEEMERMTEATLQFARDDAVAEPSRTVDLTALIASLVDDLAEMGKPVAFAEAERLPYTCRPTALKRALGNLIENAIQYGGRAEVAIDNQPTGPVITVDDHGPGIPEGEIEEAFKPFVRLESSRNRATGGAGLGLAIARSIVLAHGGELTLANRPGGGLRAEIRLPGV